MRALSRIARKEWQNSLGLNGMRGPIQRISSAKTSCRVVDQEKIIGSKVGAGFKNGVS
jgi:hypothetical protein